MIPGPILLGAKGGSTVFEMELTRTNFVLITTYMGSINSELQMLQNLAQITHKRYNSQAGI